MRIAYICVSNTCGREIEVESSHMNGTFSNPTCACGSEMQPLKKSAKTKKPYEPPELVVYGDIERLTRASGMTAIAVDSMLATKTH